MRGETGGQTGLGRNTHVSDELLRVGVDGEVDDGSVASDVEDGVEVGGLDGRELDGGVDQLLGGSVGKELLGLGVLGELRTTQKNNRSKVSIYARSCLEGRLVTHSLSGSLVEGCLSSGGGGERELERVLELVVRVRELREVVASLATS